MTDQTQTRRPARLSYLPPKTLPLHNHPAGAKIPPRPVSSPVSIIRSATTTTSSSSPRTAKPTIASLARTSTFASRTRTAAARFSSSSSVVSAPSSPAAAVVVSSGSRRLSATGSAISATATASDAVPGVVILRPVPASARTRSTRLSLGVSSSSSSLSRTDKSTIAQSSSKRSGSTTSAPAVSKSPTTGPSSSADRRSPPSSPNSPPEQHAQKSSSIKRGTNSSASTNSSPTNPSRTTTRRASTTPAAASSFTTTATITAPATPKSLAFTPTPALQVPAVAATTTSALFATSTSSSSASAISRTSRTSQTSKTSKTSRTPSTTASAVAISTTPIATTLSCRQSTTTPTTDKMPPVVKAASTIGTTSHRSNNSLTPKMVPLKGTRVVSSSATPAARKRGSLTTGEPSPVHDYPPPTSAPKMASNITPRSGPRQHRVDSSNTTPLGTPNPAHDSFDIDALRRQAFSPPQPTTPKDDLDAKFFYASDVNAKLPSAPKLAPPTQKQTGFLYANGGQVESPTQRHPSLNLPYKVSSQLGDDLPSKFFYANGTPEVEPSHRSSTSSSNVSNTSRSRPASGVMPSPGFVATQRPMSPKKASSTVGVPLKPPVQNRPMSISNPPPMAPGNGSASQRNSMDAHQGRGHVRSGSNFSQSEHGSGPTSPQQHQRSYSNASSVIPSPSVMQPHITMASIMQSAEEFNDSEDDISESGSESDSESGSESDEYAAPVTETVLNARSQRKVQDLEIRNASLEAINKTLERQMRKQQAELRRFRRMYRQNAANSLKVPGADSSVLSDLAEEGDTDADDTSMSIDEPRSQTASTAADDNVVSEDKDMEPEEDEDEDSIISSSSESNADMSPNAKHDKELRRQARDERRLQLDLSKHRELLIDSQKINQSLKRCLNWTEELIKEGRKALVYQVHVPDTKVGGRVLDPLDLETDDEAGEREYPVFYPRTGAISPSIAESGQETENDEDEDDGEDTETETEGEAPRQKPYAKLANRDSGVEMPMDGTA